ncbi:hypothetical protein AB0G85_32060 [Streptomyces sioyaensis]|uniref:hypothetical protein n=1 Tax=Streptomyces sioyaensis TaxID=67364 RepID=UPI0033FA3797
MLQNSPSGFLHPNISAAIREIAPTAVLVRVYPERRSATPFFESDFYRMLIDRRTEEEAACKVRRSFGKATDRRLAHGLSPRRRIAIVGGEH